MEHGQFVDYLCCYPCECSPGYGHQTMGVDYSSCYMGFYSYYLYVHADNRFHSNFPKLLVCISFSLFQIELTQYLFITRCINYFRTIYRLASSRTYWLTILLTMILALLPRFLCIVIHQIFWPSDIQIAREAEILRKTYDQVGLKLWSCYQWTSIAKISIDFTFSNLNWNIM